MIMPIKLTDIFNAINGVLTMVLRNDNFSWALKKTCVCVNIFDNRLAYITGKIIVRPYMCKETQGISFV